MIAILGRLLTFLFLLLCAATITEWVRSKHHVDILLIRTTGHHLAGVAADRGGVVVVWTDLAYDGMVLADGDSKGTWGMSVTPDEFQFIHDLLFDTTMHKFAFHGLITSGGKLTTPSTGSPTPVSPNSANPAQFSALLIPFWPLVVIFAIPVLFLARGPLVRRRRRRKGLCIGCGYDIRASTGKCPECGREIPITGG